MCKILWGARRKYAPNLSIYTIMSRKNSSSPPALAWQKSHVDVPFPVARAFGAL